MMREFSRVIHRSINRPIHGASTGLASYAGPPFGALTISDESAIDGDEIIFDHTIVAATSFQLYKDGVWVFGGDTLPLTLRVGPLDSGDYTIIAEGPGGTLETDAVALTVAANDLVNDTFTSGSPSANWSSTSGTNTVTSQRLIVGSSSGYLERAITENKTRISFVCDPTSCTDGNTEIFYLIGNANVIMIGMVIVTGASKSLRFSANVAGHLAGGESYMNYNTISGYTTSTLIDGNNTIELLWDQGNRRVEIYVNGICDCVVDNITDYPSFAIQPPRTFQIGRVNGTPTGTIAIDNVKIKQGNAALTPCNAGTKWAVIHINGQSNGTAGAANSYNATTDAIGDYLAAGSWSETGVAERIEGFRNWYDTTRSTHVGFAFMQNIDLPAGYSPLIVNNCVGSTSFSTDPGWADAIDSTGLYRRAAIKHSGKIAVLGADACHLAIWHQGFESDTGLSAAAYTALLAEFIIDFRTAIGDANCPVLIGGFSPAFLTGGPNETAGYITIDGANEDFAEANDGAFVSSLLPTPLTYQAGQPIHFDAAGIRALGARGAAAYLTLNPAADPA